MAIKPRSSIPGAVLDDDVPALVAGVDDVDVENPTRQ